MQRWLTCSGDDMARNKMVIGSLEFEFRTRCVGITCVIPDDGELEAGVIADWGGGWIYDTNGDEVYLNPLELRTIADVLAWVEMCLSGVVLKL